MILIHYYISVTKIHFFRQLEHKNLLFNKSYNVCRR